MYLVTEKLEGRDEELKNETKKVLILVIKKILEVLMIHRSVIHTKTGKEKLLLSYYCSLNAFTW